MITKDGKGDSEILAHTRIAKDELQKLNNVLRDRKMLLEIKCARLLFKYLISSNNNANNMAVFPGQLKKYLRILLLSERDC